MKVLFVHNSYRHRGGEDACVESEMAALRAAGEQVVEFRVSSHSSAPVIYQALAAPFGRGAEKNLEARLVEVSPDIVHVHNLFPLLSPRFFQKAGAAGCRVVLTLHNYRPLCLNGLFLTPSNERCERCARGNYLHGVWRGCYRRHRLQSLGLASHLWISQRAGWYDFVDRFIAPSEFLKNKFISYGMPSDRMSVQPPFLADFPESPPELPAPYVLYLGRLSEEKGLRWLLDVFKQPAADITLRIAGEGPLRSLVEMTAGKNPAVEYLGVVQNAAKWRQLRGAQAFVMPSECYENFPVAIMEANACGTPAIVARLGGLEEAVRGAVNGMTFEPRDAHSFWESLNRLVRESNAMDWRLKCQRSARERFSREFFLKERVELYQSLLREPLRSDGRPSRQI